MRLSILLFALLSLAACGSMPQAGPAVGAPQPDLQVVTDDVREYTLGPGDKLRLIVFGEDDLSGEFLVDGSGLVSLPLVGEISAEGKTVREFQRSVESSLRDGYLNDPRVSAEVLNFRPFYILGEVNSPGTYPYSDSLTVLNAVAVAEGFTYRANQRVVFIRRDGATTEQQYPLTSTTPVRPGDTIRIAERIF
ncbi:MAG: polysaccharide export protein [Aquisalinus sp.]|nr:polysaccharide export protein [Aquisalinus sp.]